MAVKTVIDNLEDVSEALREHYVATSDGKFRLDGVEDVSGLKSALEREKEERRQAKARLDRLKDIDPEEFLRLKKDVEERENEKLARKGEYEKMLSQTTAKHKTELEKREDSIKSLRSALEANLIDAEATRAIASAKGVPELLLPHVRSSVRVVEEDGKFLAKVVDKDGNPRIGDASGSPMTVNQLVAEMRSSEVFGRAFEGTGATGSGASNSNGGRAGQKTINRTAFDALGAQEKASYVREGGTITD